MAEDESVSLIISSFGWKTDSTYAPIKKLTSVTRYLSEGGTNTPVTILYSFDIDNILTMDVFPSAGSSSSTESAYGNRYCFQGREIDWSTGLYYFRARWYNPETGRWLSKDPIGISRGLNLYVAFGNNRVFNVSGTELTASAIGNRYCFQGREIDWSTGLYYFRARWYNPETGRWLSKDPIGIAGGLNQYVAFGNNPANNVDPKGTFAL